MYRPILLLVLFLSSLNVQAELTINTSFARAVPVVVKNSAVFLSINNSGEQDRAIVAAQSAVSEIVELHTHIQDQGVMRMRKIDQIELSAGQTTELKPGGLHIMLIGLHGALEVGQQVELELEFDDGSKQRISAPVREVMGPMMQHKKPMMH